jgi:hypothetical protein
VTSDVADPRFFCVQHRAADIPLDDCAVGPWGTGLGVCRACFAYDCDERTVRVPRGIERDINAEDAALLLHHFNDEESALLLRRSARRSTDA